VLFHGSSSSNRVKQPKRRRSDTKFIMEEVERMKQLTLLSFVNQTTRVALVGGNHTAARFCSR
jgi:hypothetical protein